MLCFGCATTRAVLTNDGPRTNCSRVRLEWQEDAGKGKKGPKGHGCLDGLLKSSIGVGCTKKGKPWMG